MVSELLASGASVALRDLGGQTALGAAYDGLQAVAKYVEDALQLSAESVNGFCPANMRAGCSTELYEDTYDFV